MRLIAERQVPQHLRRRGKHLEFKHPAVHDAADADLIFPAWHIRSHQRILSLIHGLADGAKLFRRVQLLLHFTALLDNHLSPQEYQSNGSRYAKTVRLRSYAYSARLVICDYLRLFGECATAFDRFGKRVQQLFGTFPRHAGVGDGFAVLELVERSGLLIAGFQEAFHHDAADARLSRCDTGGDVFDHFGFAHFVLAAVAVRRVDDKTVFARPDALETFRSANAFATDSVS